MPLTEDRKGTQRERLLRAMTEVVADGGYDAASVARVGAAAGVSRRTFYEQFRDRDDCVIAALLAVQEQLRADVEHALAVAPPQRAWRAALAAMTDLAATDRAAARLLMSDALAAGPQALDLRDRSIAHLARSVDERYAQLPPRTPVADLSTEMLLGGVGRLLATRLHADAAHAAAHPARGETDFAALLAELSAWVASYERPLGEHRWRELRPFVCGSNAPRTPPLLTPPAPVDVRGRLSAQEAVENNRRRVLFAAAELAAERGYRASTLAEVQRRAGVDAEAFRRVFPDKRAAFAAVHEEHFRHVTAVTAGAFFGGVGEWPERIWEAARAFAQVMEQNPATAYVGFVEVHAAGPRAVQRNDELVLAFTLFLQQGYGYRAQLRAEPAGEPPTRLALEAIAATNFEIGYHQIRASRSPKLTGLVAHVTFLCLAPFVGAAAANDFIDGQLRAGTAEGRRSAEGRRTAEEQRSA
jgi:AcrR family transcriptional regulator